MYTRIPKTNVFWTGLWCVGVWGVVPRAVTWSVASDYNVALLVHPREE